MRANDMLAQGTLFRAVLSALNTGYDIARDYCANSSHSVARQTRNGRFSGSFTRRPISISYVTYR